MGRFQVIFIDLAGKWKGRWWLKTVVEEGKEEEEEEEEEEGDLTLSRVGLRSGIGSLGRDF